VASPDASKTVAASTNRNTFISNALSLARKAQAKAVGPRTHIWARPPTRFYHHPDDDGAKTIRVSGAEGLDERSGRVSARARGYLRKKTAAPKGGLKFCSTNPIELKLHSDLTISSL
jgi:hypothetical protein